MSQAYTYDHQSIKVAVTVYCRGCQFQGKGTHAFKGFVVTTKGNNTKSISSMGLTYHLKTKKNGQCRLLYKSENIFNKRKQKFDYNTSILYNII